MKPKVKAKFLLFSILQEIDYQIAHNKQITKNIKASTQGGSIKDPKISKP